MPVQAVKINVGRTRDHVPGFGRAIDLLQLSIAIFCLPDGTFRALHNRCPKGGAIVNGEMSGRFITCLDHQCCIDLFSGSLQSALNSKVETFPVEVEDGFIYVTLE